MKGDLMNNNMYSEERDTNKRIKGNPIQNSIRIMQ